MQWLVELKKKFNCMQKHSLPANLIIEKLNGLNKLILLVVTDFPVDPLSMLSKIVHSKKDGLFFLHANWIN